MSEHKTDILRGHEYDGIKEYDNRLPNWWLFLLYGSCVFALGYWLVFHTFKVVDLPLARYDEEMIAAAETRLAGMAAGGVTDESLTLMAAIPETVARGRELFSTYCTVCHLEQGQGLVGPNLTDGFWIHGDRPTDIHRVVTDGVVEKGMAAWGDQLGPSRVQDLVSFVLSIKDTNVPGKAPEGEPVAGDVQPVVKVDPDNG